MKSSLGQSLMISDQSNSESIHPEKMSGLYWLPIHLSPDVTTGEQFNIGIGVIDSFGRLHVRLVPHLLALVPLYEGRAGFDVSVLHDLLGRIHERCNGHLYAEILTQEAGSQWRLGKPAPTDSRDIDSVIKNQMEQVVPLSQCEGHAPLFEMTPQGVLGQSDTSKVWLIRCHQEMLMALGAPISAAIWPYRKGGSCWALDMQGVRDELGVTIMVTGQSRLPHSLCQDPYIEVVDDTDAYYLVRALTAPDYVDADAPFFACFRRMDR